MFVRCLPAEMEFVYPPLRSKTSSPIDHIDGRSLTNPCPMLLAAKVFQLQL